jgi:hypothetical protein
MIKEKDQMARSCKQSNKDSVSAEDGTRLENSENARLSWFPPIHELVKQQAMPFREVRVTYVGWRACPSIH